MGERSDPRAADEREPDGAAVGLFWPGIEAHARMAGLPRLHPFAQSGDWQVGARR